MRLIDANKLLKEFPIRINHYDKENGDFRYVLGIEAVMDYVKEMPTVDAEPVVRCKECSHWCICHHSDNWFCANGTPINTASDFYDDKGHLLTNQPTYKYSTVEATVQKPYGYRMGERKWKK